MMNSINLEQAEHNAKNLADSRYLAKRLRDLAELFDDSDSEKALLCAEAAINLEESDKLIHDLIVICDQKKSPE
jgi:hypothetical protein